MTAHDSQDDTRPRRGPGQPRTRPQELAGPAGMKAWRAELKRMGGGEVRAYLGGEALRALKKMAKVRERGPLVERLILEEFARRKAGR